MDAPTHLGHKPIIQVKYYNNGVFESKDSDAKALSIGKAQYDNNEISLKVWRKPRKRWSPQSEEIPIHRVLDLFALVLKCMIESKNPKVNSQKTYLQEDISSSISLNELYDFINNHKSDYDWRIDKIESLLTIYRKP